MPILAILVYHGINALIFLIVAWVLLSWFRPSRTNPLVRILNAIVEPMLAPFDKLIPSVGGIGFSALAAVLALELIQRLILKALLG